MTVAALDRGPAVAARLIDEPHHDGSQAYVPVRPTAVGQEFDVLLRVPEASAVTRVAGRVVIDGEAYPVPAVVERRDPAATWWRCRLVQGNPVVNYRFLTDGGPHGYRWVTAAGPVDHDPTDDGDFRSSIYGGGPAWLDSAVAYQIFPDRFAASGRVDVPVPEWAIPAAWDDDPLWEDRALRPRHFFGGDLFGVAEHLDHLVDLGVNLIYLTPVFPSRSNHRYDATSFDHVDPLLGGDEALVELVAAAHARGLRVIGDFTTNHTGSGHEWFIAAQSDASVDEAGFYYFAAHPDGYVGFHDHPALPKVDQSNPILRERMITSADSPIRRYLRPPFELDGWRIDVANMTGRHGSIDVTAEVARDLRATVLDERPDGYLVAEHLHDFRGDLAGAGWHGVMNASGFTDPILCWLAQEEPPFGLWLSEPWEGWRGWPGGEALATIRAFSAAPWQNLVSSFNLIGSHDTVRVATLIADEGRRIVAVGAMMTFPGVPMVWAGDELGLTGVSGEAGRRTMPWEHRERWNESMRSAYRDLIGARRRSSALRGGSMRWLHVDDDRMVFLREDAAEVVLVALARATGPDIAVASSSIGVHPEAESDSLFGNTPLRAQGESLILPGDGPSVGIWRWGRPAPNGTST